MALIKKEKINSLLDEVNSLHPVLFELFKKMPTIKNVEYTHGNREFGGDFILSQDYEPLGTIEYIGVIVKARSITQSSLEDVERQIKECSMPRLIENGKKKIVLSAIWIVSSQNIASNAQDKINYSFSDKKMQFIDEEKLVWLIDKYLPDYWYDIELQISSYLTQVRIKIEEEDKRFTLIPNLSTDLYIEPDIVRLVKEGYDYKDGKKKHLYENIDIYEEIKQHRFVLVEGQMGAGKSKLLRHIGLHYANPDIFIDEHIIPITVNYRTLCEQYECTLSNLLIEYSKKYNIGDIENTDILMLIDGFDEFNESIDDHYKKVRSLLSQKTSFQKLSIIIATRYMNIINVDEFNRANAKKVEISSLSVKKMIEFLLKLCRQLSIADRIIEDITKSPLMRELPQSPIAAILLAKIIENNSKDLPSNMPELYQKYLELALGRWDMDKGLESQKEYDVALAIVTELAFYFIDNEIDEVSDEQLNRIIENYLKPRNLELDSMRIIEILTSRSGIIVRNIGNNTILFSHRTFAEYFYAKGKSDTNSLEINDRVYTMYWMNIYYFYIGIKRDCYEYLHQIINLLPKNESQKLIRIVNMSNYLMAGYSSPYKIVEENLYKILLEAGSLYKEILDHSSKSVLREFPEVVLLWWMQYTMRTSYSYRYFSKAIDDTILRIIDSTQYDHTIKACSLFFLAMIGLEHDNKNALDYLISEYREDLPEAIQIGIINEVERLDAKNEKERKSIKWFGKRLKTLENKYIHDLFELPISKRKIT